ncbi:hypothetical protein AWB85_21355 [Mycobacteroides immunogenum]|uniref:PPE family domain-containing protein n=1 Tax=Mycobacteroides immunogenum TaxID=83262 RepID=A0A179VEA4_9MYCO|nr:PPE family protein [Mycobacteroides immunogenum]OAT69315.1 hypothetical protein AWB85_21355 [Mycobacteroides immunogenum]
MTAPIPPLWIAAPPEVHSTLLNFGPGAGLVAQGGLSWGTHTAMYTTAATELTEILHEAGVNYAGPSAAKFIAAHGPMLTWIGMVIAKSTVAAEAHTTVTAEYEAAQLAMPTMPELLTNHFVHGVLVGTNFFGVNTIPIGLNEADYDRMWILAANVMTGWDAGSTGAVDSIPPSTPSPILLLPGVGEAGSAAADAAAQPLMAEGAAGGVLMNGADVGSTKQLVGKIATSPLSLDNALRQPNGESGQAQGMQPENIASSGMQQVGSMIPQAVQGATSALQGGPQQLLSQAPQLVSQAPQALGQMLGQFGGSGLGSGSQPASVPVGFAGTGAIRGFNPAGLTSLAGGAYGSGPTKPLLPSTWGTPSTSAELSNNLARGIPGTPPAMAGAGASTGAGGGMMGAGAGRRNSKSQRVTTYGSSESAEDDADTATTQGRGHY